MASLDQIAQKYKEAKLLPKYRDLIDVYRGEYPKFPFFAMYKIMNELVLLMKANPQDNSIRELFPKVREVAEKSKASTGASIQDDADSFKAFVAQKFQEPDAEVRNLTATPQTIIKMLNAAYLIDMLNIFGPLTEEAKTRRKYAKAMAAKMKKNIDERGNVNAGLEASIPKQVNFEEEERAYEEELRRAGQQVYPNTQANMNPFENNPQNARNTSDNAYNPFDDHSENIVVNPTNRGTNPYPFPTQTGNNFSQSSLASAEKDTLDKALKLGVSRYSESLNYLFRLDQKTVQQPSPQATTGTPSFMNSSLYRQNKDEFQQRGFEIYDKIKEANNAVSNDLGRAYEKVWIARQAMDQILMG